MSAVTIIELPFTENTALLFEAVRDMPAPIWLDSGEPGAQQGRFDIISAAPCITMETQGLRTTVTRKYISGSNCEQFTDDPFSLGEQILEDMGSVNAEINVPFCGGLAGYFAYNAEQTQVPGSSALTDLAALPDVRLGYYTWALIIDRHARKALAIFQPACSKTLKKDVLARLAAVPTKTTPVVLDRHYDNDDFRLSTVFKPSMSKAEYLKKVANIQDYINAGDCYQVNFSQHFLATYEGDPWFAYEHLRNALPSPFSAFMSWDDKAILSLSPERFIKLNGDKVETRPIKGTAPRGINLLEDTANANALINSSKDRAENLMIVDLLRNDLGKTCRTGSIEVKKLFELESFANVHHLVSTVTGVLENDKTAIKLLAGCFPGGSITGAPKKRAMEIIQEMENIKRSVYCGSIGYISACGNMDTNIAIRTLVANGGQLHCWGGGGIVADSLADSEYAESLSKIALLMEILNKSHVAKN